MHGNDFFLASLKNQRTQRWCGISGQAILLLTGPLLLLVCAIGLGIGFWGEPVRLWFEHLRHAHPRMTSFFLVITNYSGPLIYVMYMGMLVDGVLQRRREQVMFAMQAFMIFLMVAVMVTQLLKVGLGMPRPGYPSPLQPFAFMRTYASWPSGHTVTVVAGSLPLAFWFRHKGVWLALALLITLTGYSRLWLGMHHPVDIVGGIVVGTAGMVYLCRKIFGTVTAAAQGSRR